MLTLLQYAEINFIMLKCVKGNQVKSPKAFSTDAYISEEIHS